MGLPDTNLEYFVEPTALVDINNSAQACQHQIAGLVTTIIPVGDADDALSIVNDSDCGLVGYIWTDSQATAHYVNHWLQAGMIWITAGFERDLRQSLKEYERQW